jgi:hypothetical protein
VSDLSSQQVTQQDTFDASEYVRSLCVNTKMIVPEYVTIQFLPGWKDVVADLIESIKGYPIQLTLITDSYSILEVKFSLLKLTREANVWRAIDHACEQSQITCAQCGDRIKSRRNLAAGMFCEVCTKNAGLLGKTGTWLDKY